jgi:hypothetical protein
MAVPTFVGAGTGAAGAATPLTVSKSCTAGNLVLIHVLQDGTTGNVYFTSAPNLEDIAGVDGTLDHPMTGVIGSPTAGKHDFWLGRAISSASACTMTFRITSGTDNLFARMYEFSGVSTSVTYASVVEAIFDLGGGTGTTISAGGVTTAGADRLAVLLIGVNNDTTISEITGESGGNWAEPTAEFSSATGGSIGIQTASMAGAGTISGGSCTLGTSSGHGQMSVALIGAAAAPATSAGQILLLGAG